MTDLQASGPMVLHINKVLITTVSMHTIYDLIPNRSWGQTPSTKQEPKSTHKLFNKSPIST